MSTLALASLFLQQQQVPTEVGLGGWLVVLVFYLFVAYCFVKIAEKTGTEPAWWGWIPILNVFLLLKVAGRAMWWFILLLIPLVNAIVAIVVWVDVCKARGKSPWLVIGLLIPVVNLITLGYLAFSE